MQSHQVDQLNIALIFVSLLAAFIFPFELFLFAYAFLGPLHYLTEINWLNKKEYFIPRRKSAILLVTLALIVSIPYILYIPVFNMRDSELFNFMLEYIVPINVCFFIALGLAVALVFARTRKHWIIASIMIISGAILVNYQPDIWVWFAIFLPTIIHVYIFTILFMWYGTIRSASRWGSASVIILVLIPLFIIFADVDINTYGGITEGMRNLVKNGFTNLHQKLGLWFQKESSTLEFYTSPLFVKLQIFIAFAYTYHYLNWFSKTTVIGWHKNLTSSRVIIIGAVWILSVSLYLYDYGTGLAALFLLSVLHVFLEFPLNVVSVKGIIKHYAGKQ